MSYFYSEKSKGKLLTCHPDLQLIFNYAIRDKDIAIICGNRPVSEQFELFKIGRKLVNGIWVIDDSLKVVTYKDGKDKKSEHNYIPSKAIDAVEWFKEKPHIRWKNKNSFFELNNILQSHTNFLYNTGKITHRLFWGGWWRMRDLPHWQLKKV